MDKQSERWKTWFSRRRTSSTNAIDSQAEASAVVVNHDEFVAAEVEHEANFTGEESSFELKTPPFFPVENDSLMTTLDTFNVSAADSFSESGSPNRYTHTELRGMTDSELFNVLRRSWGCAGNKLEVWGRLTVVGPPDKQFVKLSDVRSVRDNTILSYPCEVPHTLIDRGIYIHPEYGWELAESGHKLFRSELELAPHKEREKHGNPLQVNVRPGSAIPLRRIPVPISERLISEQLISTEDAVLISERVYEHYLGLRKQELCELEATLKSEVETNVETAKQALTEVLNAQQEAQAQMIKARNDHVQFEQENARMREAISELQCRQTEETEKLAVMQATYEKTEKKMSYSLERLKHYIEDKATILKQLEFIDAEEFELLFADRRDNRRDGGRLSFEQDLGGEYARAVSYIQAYLLGRDILYPRHVLENFFALLRTHDLIILAGDSGSGKTNLVQSFAGAIGGVAKIVPVKPNWTSSEDLLGYYNPLEKKYLATPFLEALIEANKNPDVPYLICLDEMNLARVEYYFADFLSKLEQRNGVPEIELFSDNESAHVLSELRQVMEIIRGAKDKYQKEDVVTFVKLLQDEEINAELRRAFGFSDKDSLIKYHSDIRHMLSGILNTPSSLRFPSNVRIIGAINIDETTHYLSPKILDRAHVMKFKSPLLTDWQSIIDQVASYGFDDVSKPLQVDLDDLGQRVPYPKFDQDHPFCRRFVELNREYFHPLGVEFGLRAIRQGLNYLAIFSEFNNDDDLAINNFVLHKVLPKLTFDGNKEAVAGVTKLDLLFGLAANLDNALELAESLDDEFSVKKALPSLANKAKANDGIVNYWS